jgi:hypothetical protein
VRRSADGRPVCRAHTGALDHRPGQQQHVLLIHVSSLGAPGPASFDAVYQKILGDAYDRHDPHAARDPRVMSAAHRGRHFISASALGRARGGGFLHDRGLDAPRVSHVRHGLCDRTEVRVRPHPRLNAAVGRGLHAPDRTSFTDPTDRAVDGPRLLICDRGQKRSTAVRHLLATSGIRVIRTLSLLRSPSAR